jgi:uncharacterized protein (TIGR00106 family)
MIAAFSMVPIGCQSASLGDKVAQVLKIVDESGLTYRLTPMNTIVEGDWDEVMALVKRCRDELMQHEERALISISIDDRKGKSNRMVEKMASVEKALGRELKK